MIPASSDRHVCCCGPAAQVDRDAGAVWLAVTAARGGERRGVGAGGAVSADDPPAATVDAAAHHVTTALAAEGVSDPDAAAVLAG